MDIQMLHEECKRRVRLVRASPAAKVQLIPMPRRVLLTLGDLRWCRLVPEAMVQRRFRDACAPIRSRVAVGSYELLVVIAVRADTGIDAESSDRRGPLLMDLQQWRWHEHAH